MEGYQNDLAYIHDVGFGGFCLNAAPGLLAILRRCKITRGLVVDVGCGSGLWARELVRAGYDVLGIDISASMIKIARERVPEARFKKGSLLQIRLPQCDAVTSIGECVAYLFDTKNSKREFVRFFARVYDALRPGGAFVFDVAEPGQVRGSRPRRRHFQGKDWAVLVEVEEDPKQDLLTRRITTFRRVGKLYRRGEETHRLQLYTSAELARELRGAGFRVRVLRGYGQFRLPGAHVGFLARKP